MSPNKFFEKNDPRLTAYALGEISGEEAEKMRAAVEADPEAAAFVAETRELAKVLNFELAKETQPRLSMVQRDALLKQKKKEPFLSRWVYVTGGLATAAIAIVLVLRDAEEPRLMRAKSQPFFSQVQNAPNEAAVSDFAKPESKSKAVGKRAQTAPSEYQNMDDSLSNSVSADQMMNAPAAAPSVAMGSGGYGLSGGGAARARLMRKGGGGLSEGFKSMEIEQQNLAEGKWNTEAYSHQDENGWKKSVHEPLSTFSIDVDTAAYSNMRRFLTMGQLPPKDAVRIEELVNYFPYSYAPPTDSKPFAVHVEMAETPWTSDHRIVRIALKGKELAPKERPVLNLVFLIDVSGSMNEPNKLPLVQQSLKLLTDQLRDKDRVAIVVYAGASGLLLPPTSGENKQKIKEAIDGLTAGGGTNGAGGIELAYKTLSENFVKGGTNRVVLATDGDFNLGVTNEGDLVRLIEQKAKGGAFLTVLGFGMGNYKDANLVKLSDKGNGNYAYIDTFAEAKKALVEQLSGTLVTIAKDVKIQVEFNPAYVGSYRLVGYEKRLLNKEDFNDDKKDAGEIGAGHTVTALYEITAPGKDPGGKTVDPLKYGDGKEAPSAGKKNGEALTVKLRYKEPDGDVSKLIEIPVKDETKDFTNASSDFKFASAVAAFGMLLKDSEHKGASSFEAVAATAAKNLDVKGKENEHRKEFVELVRKAGALKK